MGENVTVEFTAEGTTCESCEKIIKKQAMKVPGVSDVKFDYKKELGEVTYDASRTDMDTILYKIEEKGYKCYLYEGNTSPWLGWAFSALGIAIIGFFLYRWAEGIAMPDITSGMGIGLLFLVGVLTGFHCVGMCGGFVVGYTANQKRPSSVSHLLYGAGKVVSYTVIGALFGLLGSFVAFTPTLRGVAGMLAGIFLITFGLRMLDIFPMLRKFSFRTPRFITRLLGKSRGSSPLVIGLLNGLMIACGPLQAFYIMAAGTGSMLEGAKLLFIFGLGTLPVMLGFGFVVSSVSAKVTHKILKASGAIVIVLGIVMLNNGISLTGSGYDVNSMVTSVSALSDEPVVINQGYQEIRMDVTRNGWEPNKFVLKKDVPVRWVINGKEVNGCNNAIQVPKFGLNFPIKPGEQVIEFTPTEEGVISWSCWMGMIPGTFIVKEDIDVTNQQAVEKELSQVQVPRGGTCGGGGSCGCGG